jgi:hypothetical protein
MHKIKNNEQFPNIHIGEEGRKPEERKDEKQGKK